VDLGDGGWVVGVLGHGEFGEFGQEGFAHRGRVLRIGFHEVGEQRGALYRRETDSDSHEVSARGAAIDESEGESLENLVDGDHGGGAVFDGREIDVSVVGAAEALDHGEATSLAVLEFLVEVAIGFALESHGSTASSVEVVVKAGASSGHKYLSVASS
jgi:hypothetical protein